RAPRGAAFGGAVAAGEPGQSGVTMKYRVTIGERNFVLDIEETNGQRRLAVDAQPVEADVAEISPDRTFSLLISGRSYTASVARSGEGYAVAVAGRVYELSVVDERTRALTQLAPGHGAEGELI